MLTRSTTLLVVSLLLLSCGLPSVVHASSANQPPLVARANGSTLSFKILQLADLHFTGDPTFPCKDSPMDLPREDAPCTEALMSKFVDQLLDAEKPDFVVFSGDNVEAYYAKHRKPAVDAFTKGVEERKIPYAVIFGNHDDGHGFPREEIMKLVMQKEHSYAQRGPTNVNGVGNYQLSVQAPIDGPWGNANDRVFHMYFLDSGAYPSVTDYLSVDSKYDWIRPNQVEFYRNLSLTNQKDRAKPLPALMFFHIPLQEHTFDEASDAQFVTGEKNELVASSRIHSEIFSALVERNEVKAVFVGHDHVNEYCFKRQGVQLCYGGGAGFGVAYGWSSMPRRARVIEWSVDDSSRRTIKSWKRLFGSVSETCCEETLFDGIDSVGSTTQLLVPGPAGSRLEEAGLWVALLLVVGIVLYVVRWCTMRATSIWTKETLAGDPADPEKGALMGANGLPVKEDG
ncbi:Purple acid phosphatase 29 isoform 1, partial [Globisporangium polare]